MTDGELIGVVNKIDGVFIGLDGAPAAIALGLFIGVAAARCGSDLDAVFNFLRGVAADGVEMCQDGRISEVSGPH